MNIRFSGEEFRILCQLMKEASNVSPDRASASSFSYTHLTKLVDVVRRLREDLAEASSVTMVASDVTQIRLLPESRDGDFVVAVDREIMERWQAVAEFLGSLHSPYEIFLRTGYSLEQITEVVRKLPRGA
ncbi:hypothetical protein OG937_11290 [Streptomyces sp. NBC_00510]